MASVAKRKRTKADGTPGDKWTVRYIDSGGQHRQRTFERKKDAESYRVRIEGERARGLLMPQADRVTIGQAADAFEAYMHERRRDGRIGETHRYRVSVFVNTYVRPYFSNLTLYEINLDRLTKWNAEIQRDRKISPHTAKQAANTLKMIFDFCIRREWIARNPVLQLLKELRGLKVTPVRTFTVEQVRKLLETVGQKTYQGRRDGPALRLQCAVHLATFCGLRIGEIFGLQAGNIDFERQIIHVRTSLSRRDGLKGPKSAAGVRDVAMPAHVAVLLRAWIDRYQRPDHAGLMFCLEDGRPYHNDSFRHGSWGPLLKRAGLTTDHTKPEFHFHALRHFAASWMIDAGWSLPEVAKSLGHAKVDMTLSVYAHALQHRSGNVVEMQALSDRLLLPAPIAVAHPLRMAS